MWKILSLSLCFSLPSTPSLDLWRRHHVRESLQFSHRYQSGATPAQNVYTSGKQDAAGKEISSVMSSNDKSCGLWISLAFESPAFNPFEGKSSSICEHTGMSFWTVKTVEDFHAAQVLCDLNSLPWMSGETMLGTRDKTDRKGPAI